MGLRTIKIISITGLALLVATGCKREAEKSTPNEGSAPPAKPAATLTQWTQSVANAFDKIDVKRLRDPKNPAYVQDQGSVDEDGVAKFFACFEKSPPKCDLAASGRRDNFRKIQFFTDPGLDWTHHGASYTPPFGKSSVGAYIALRDCGKPSLVLQPTFRSSNWIFLERFQIMADGAVILDRTMNTKEIDRENSNGWVTESADLALSSDEVAALKKTGTAQQILMRLTGQKGYVGIDVKTTDSFVAGVARSIRIYDDLFAATTLLGAVGDPGCPR